MNDAIEQLELRLQKLEQLRAEKHAWLTDLIAPVEARLENLAKLRRDQNVETASNIVRFPLEKRMSNDSVGKTIFD